jgi:hypothetical protein
MKIKNLKPSEIITTRDFPVHNEHILKIYFKVCKKDKDILPPTPVVPLSKGLPLLPGKTKKDKEYNLRIKKYLKENKKIKYVMCDGSHKTTALTLTNNKIHSAILERDKDVKEFHDLVSLGEIFSLSAGSSIKQILLEKAEHLKDAEFFESVLDKTKRMVEKKVIPNFMIDYYRKR